MKFLVSFVVLIASISSCFTLKDAVCGLPPFVNGLNGVACLGNFSAWSYNITANECGYFIYGGCWGNANRFDAKELCEEKCLE